MNDYPSNLNVQPLTTWPGELTAAHKRERSPFSATLSATLSVLSRELDMLGARGPILEVAIDPVQFRIDGRPRAQAKAAHPGVVLSLPRTTEGPLRYATDRFTSWQENLRAIALGLEALRKVERYGITRRGEQYQGFRAIESGQSAIAMGPAVPMSKDEAVEELSVLAGFATPVDWMDPMPLDIAWKRARANTHPDRRGGDRQEWDRVETLGKVLGLVS